MERLPTVSKRLQVAIIEAEQNYAEDRGLIFSASAKDDKRGIVLSVGGLPLWRAKLRAVAPHLSSDHTVECFTPLLMPRLILKARRHDIKEKS